MCAYQNKYVFLVKEIILGDHKNFTRGRAANTLGLC